MSEESQSAFSASNSKVEREEDFKAYADEDGQPMVEIPKKPASAYTLIFILCLFIAFGGFVFGWDTGTISGFVAEEDFIKRLG